jgi:hypothetical protein
MARNGEELHASYVTTQRQMPNGTLEVILRSVKGDGGTLAVADVSPFETGSTVTLWLMRNFISDRPALVRALLNAC